MSRRVLATLLFIAVTSVSAGAQVNPPGITPATAPAELYVPLRDAFLATLRANASTDSKFAYASALQKAQQGDILGAQHEAAQAMLSTPSLPLPILQSLKTAIAQPLTSLPPASLTAPALPITIAPGPGVAQIVPKSDDPVAALAFARSEIDLAELRVGHRLEDARAAYVEAVTAYQGDDRPAAVAAARKAADAALNAYLGGR
ncbi:MAG TPA: hypothetical protein VN905_09560 [Candidatus Binatia bacterium]|nr:hypothetical protein [Candidatus Binatia bacterium]